MCKQWYVCYIKQPRKIKLLPSVLRSVSKDSRVWMPTSLVKQKVVKKGKEQDVWEEIPKPVFPHYIFVQFDEDKLLEVETAVKSQCKGLLLRAGDSQIPKALTEKEIKTVEDVVAEQNKHVPVAVPHNLEVGQFVEVPGGMRGVIKEIKDVVAIVAVTLFGRPITTPVEVDQCSPVSQSEE